MRERAREYALVPFSRNLSEHTEMREGDREGKIWWWIDCSDCSGHGGGGGGHLHIGLTQTYLGLGLIGDSYPCGMKNMDGCVATW